MTEVIQPTAELFFLCHTGRTGFQGHERIGESVRLAVFPDVMLHDERSHDDCWFHCTFVEAEANIVLVHFVRTVGILQHW